MMNTEEANVQARPRRASTVTPILVGCGAFAIGAVLTFGYVQWKSQQQQMALMTQMIQQMGQQPAAAQIATTTDVVTRSKPINLLNLSAEAAPVVARAVAPDADKSTADKLRALVSAAGTPTNVDQDTLQVTAKTRLDDKAIENARRMETFAIIHAGVQELVAAVVLGEYDIHTDYADADFSGRIHFAFVGHEENQKELERFLASAAEAGIVAHSKSVVDGNGAVNGHILLFDLVERALQNGTLVEQRAGDKMRKEALALLAKDATVGEAANSAGERFYTVETGDSLAYIALQFYGNTNAYNKIYQANRNVLSSPEKIQIGQRLVIPSA